MGRRLLLCATVLTLLSISSRSEVQSTSFKIVNNCRRTIWPALAVTIGTAQLPTTGFTLRSGQSKNISIPNSWNGRIWARTHCGQDSSGKFTCLSGDCGSGELECNGGTFEGPATLAEFSLKAFDGMDFYDVSVVNGFNLPMLVTANAKTGACATAGCLVDLNSACPKVLSVTSGDGREDGVVACRNACVIEDWQGPSPEVTTKCGRSLYALFFRSACPRAYIYPFDDRYGTLTCRSANYTITFCPLPNTGKSND